ncbi:MAG TPA: hypothetical protein IAC82_02895 [Candidatus Merdivicinus intestinigallinarum]|nr:hypothetical protein [Candidatus Merdivicinus intestinigallinarum]
MARFTKVILRDKTKVLLDFFQKIAGVEGTESLLAHRNGRNPISSRLGREPKKNSEPAGSPRMTPRLDFASKIQVWNFLTFSPQLICASKIETFV